MLLRPLTCMPELISYSPAQHHVMHAWFSRVTSCTMCMHQGHACQALWHPYRSTRSAALPTQHNTAQFGRSIIEKNMLKCTEWCRLLIAAGAQELPQHHQLHCLQRGLGPVRHNARCAAGQIPGPLPAVRRRLWLGRRPCAHLHSSANKGTFAVTLVWSSV